MKSHWFFLLLSIIPICLCNSLCRAEEAELTLDSVLEKWEKASQECKIFDTKLALFQYDSNFPTDKPKVIYGRFYFESSKTARIDISKKPVFETNDWSAIDGSLIWNGTEALRIYPNNHLYYKMPIAKIEDAWAQPHKGFSGFFAKLELAALPLPRPQFLCPLLIDVSAEEVHEKYDITFERQGEDVLITAVLKKHDQEILCHDKSRVLLDSKNFQTKAVQYVDDWRHYYSIALYDQKINKKPSDRNHLIEPDLSKFHKETLLESTGSE